MERYYSQAIYKSDIMGSELYPRVVSPFLLRI